MTKNLKNILGISKLKNRIINKTRINSDAI